MKSNSSKSESWTLIIIMYFLFFPVGMVLLYRKIAIDKSSDLNSSKNYNIIGWLITIIFLLFMLVEMRIDNGLNSKIAFFFIMGSIYGAPGILSILKARKIKQINRLYDKYMEIAGHNYITHIEDIMKKVNVSYEEAIKDLKNMIGLSYFKDGYLDMDRRQLVIPYFHEFTKVIICKNCGAKNMVSVGIAAKCEYCESPIA